MVNVSMKTGSSQKSLRGQRTQENLDRLRANAPKGVRVVPGAHPSMTEEQIRKNIKHARGIAFRPSGSVEWPNDRFTQKLLRAGVVKLAEAKPEGHREAHKPERHHRHEQPQRPTES